MNEIKFTINYDEPTRMNVSIIGTFTIQILQECIQELITVRDGLAVEISELKEGE